MKSFFAREFAEFLWVFSYKFLRKKRYIASLDLPSQHRCQQLSVRCISSWCPKSIKDDYDSMLFLGLKLSIHLLPLIRGRVAGVAVPAERPKCPFPGHINQLWLGDPKALPGQRRDIIPWSLPSWTCLEHLPGGILTRCPNHVNFI